MQRGQVKKTIVHILWDFYMSGAHIFAVNLANEQAKDYNVILININPRRADPTLTNRIDPKVNVIDLAVSRVIRGTAYHIGDFFSGKKQNAPLFAGIIAFRLMKILKGTDIVHTHFVRERYIVSKAMQMLGKKAPKHIMTDHGGFLGLETHFLQTGKKSRQYNKKVFDSIVASCACVVTVSEPQNSFWQRRQQEGYPIKFNKIYHGNPSAKRISITRAEMGFREKDFVFVMVARGDEPSKGWEVTINAFLSNNDPHAKLMLVGGGSEVDRLKMIHGQNPAIKFTGVSQNPADLLQIADAGVLASTFGAESLPNTIIEYLKAGKPVIGSDIGEVKNMLQTGKAEAGILLPIEQNKIDPATYAAAMRKMQHDRAAYAYFQKNAINAAKLYDMDYCARRYATEIYGFTEE